LKGVAFPAGWRLEGLQRSHKRKSFSSGEEAVDSWLRQNAWQSQSKRLTSTKVLIDENDRLAGYYTLATAQVDFSDLPPEMVRKLPRQRLPVAVLTWLGVDHSAHRRGIGARLLATALRDCFEASQTFAFVAVILDCLNNEAKKFYERFDFQPLPGYPMRLFRPAGRLEAMMKT